MGRQCQEQGWQKELYQDRVYQEQEYKEGVRRACYEEVYQGKECQKSGILDEVCFRRVLGGCARSVYYEEEYQKKEYQHTVILEEVLQKKVSEGRVLKDRP